VRLMKKRYSMLTKIDSMTCYLPGIPNIGDTS